MRALVTGHRGFVGRWLCELLEAEGLHVSGLDYGGANDIRSYEVVRRAVELAVPDYVFHLAAQAYVPEAAADPHRAFETNCVGTVNVLEAVRRVAPLGCRVLVAGTSEEYGYGIRSQTIDEFTPLTPTTIYGASKAAGSLAALGYAKQHHLPVVVTRAFNHTGPGQSPAYAVSSFARRIALIEAGRLDVLEHGSLSAYRNFTDVRDVVRAYWAAIRVEQPGYPVFNIASGQTRTVGAILADLVHLTETPVLLKLNEEAHRPSGGWDFTVDTHRLEQATGWAARIPWTQTLTELLDYWRERERQ